MSVVGHCPRCNHGIEHTYPGGVNSHLARCWGPATEQPDLDRKNNISPGDWLKAHPEHQTSSLLRVEANKHPKATHPKRKSDGVTA